jgi:hypothetical protein
MNLSMKIVKMSTDDALIENLLERVNRFINKVSYHINNIIT